jgi:hypothetical protein
MNKQTFYCGTCEAKKTQSPLFLVKFNQKKIPKNFPKSETFAEKAKISRLSTIWRKSKQISYLPRHLLRFYEPASVLPVHRIQLPDRVDHVELDQQIKS